MTAGNIIVVAICIYLMKEVYGFVISVYFKFRKKKETIDVK